MWRSVCLHVLVSAFAAEAVRDIMTGLFTISADMVGFLVFCRRVEPLVHAISCHVAYFAAGKTSDLLGYRR
jgi:catabolite regulation protein CreA